MIIGITGTNASGKDTIADYLRDKHGFKNYSLSDEIRIELTERGMNHTRENMFSLGNEIRTKFEANELALRTVKRIKKDGAENIAVTSIRNPAELTEFKKNFPDFKMIFVDAPIKIRYERAKSRGRIGEGESFDDFNKKEERELVGGKNEQQLLACRDLADIKIINDRTIIELGKKIESILNLK